MYNKDLGTSIPSAAWQRNIRIQYDLALKLKSQNIYGYAATWHVSPEADPGGTAANST